MVSDTERLYTKIMEAICQEHGHTFTWDIKVKQMGKKEREAAKVLIGRYGKVGVLKIEVVQHELYALISYPVEVHMKLPNGIFKWVPCSVVDVL